MVVRGAVSATTFPIRGRFGATQWMLWRSPPGTSFSWNRLQPCLVAGEGNPEPQGDDGTTPIPRRRGRPRKSQQQPGKAGPEGLDRFGAYRNPVVVPESDDESATGHSQRIQTENKLELQQPEQPRRRGRPPKPPSNTCTAIRRPRGRPRLSSLPGSPLPAGACPSRDLELRTLLLRQLDLQPSELSPPRSSWRKLMASTTAAALGGRVTELCDALGPEVVRHIVARCPHALQMTTDCILSKLAELNLRLQLPRNELIGAVCRFPALLGGTPEAVGARMTLLVQELGKPEEFVRAMVVSQPVLLGLSLATLKYRVGLLHEAASLLPKWSLELTSAGPSTLGRLLRCSDAVLSRLTYTYLRTATNGKKFHQIRSMATICCQPAVRWLHENPPFADWLAAGEEDRRAGRVARWPGWLQGVPPTEVDWWEGLAAYGPGLPAGDDE